MPEHNANTLRGQCISYEVVLVIEVIVRLKSQVSSTIKQIFNVKIANKIGVLAIVSIVAITKIAIKEQAVVKQLARQCQVNINIREVTFLRMEVWRYSPLVTYLSQQIAKLR